MSIFKRKQAAQPGNSSALSELALNSINDGVIITDQAGTIYFINPAAQRMVEMMALSPIGSNYKSVVRLESKEGRELTEQENPLIIAMNAGQPLESFRGSLIVGNTAKRIPVAISVINANGGANRIITFRDITKELEEEGAQTPHLCHLVFHNEASRRCYTCLMGNAVTHEEHRQIVTLLCSVGKHGYMLFQEVNHFDGRCLIVLLHIVQYALFAKQFPATVIGGIHSLRQSVGIEQQRTAWWEVHLLFIVVIAIFHTYWQIRLYFQQTALTLCRNHHGGIMGGIAIGQVVGFHVKNAHENSYEDI